MKAGFFQFKPVLGKVDENIQHIQNIVRKTDFDLLVIPELASSGYLFTTTEEVDAVSENPVSGKYCNVLKELSVEKNACIVSGFCEQEEIQGKKNYYNSAILVYPDGRFHTYRKVHLFYEEKFWFKPGNKPFETYKIPVNENEYVIIGMMICFDWIFPEVARTLAIKGAQIICHPSNLVMPYCQRAMYARAVENHVFVITSNRTGKDEKNNRSVVFTGASVMIDPKGNYLRTADETEDEIFITNIDQSEADNKLINKYNDVIKDRREEFYF